MFQGLAFSTAQSYKNPLTMVRLLSHEVTCVYSDKMADLEADVGSFFGHRDTVIKECFGDLEWEKVAEELNLHSHFAMGIGDALYAPMKG